MVLIRELLFLALFFNLAVLIFRVLGLFLINRDLFV